MQIVGFPMRRLKSLIIFSDFSVKLVDTGSCSHKTFQGHEAPVLSVAIDPKEEYLVGTCTCITFNCIMHQSFVTTAPSLTCGGGHGL